MMNKALKAILIITLSLTFVSTALSQGLKVKSVSEDLEEVVLFDSETEEEWIALLDDEINGWTILKITHDSVTIAKIEEGKIPIVKELPVSQDLRSKTTVVPDDN
jgi:hypothetical protein